MNQQIDQTRVLVVADIWCQVDGLCDQVASELDDRNDDVLLVTPPLTGRLHTILSDTDAETAAARNRLDDALRRLREHGMSAVGLVGDADPIVAIDDALAQFEAEKVVVVTETARWRSWREKRLPGYLRGLGLPVRHLVVPHELAQQGERVDLTQLRAIDNEGW
jgi:hypothetical protein